MIISMRLAYQYIAIFFNFLTTSNHLHSLQVENCDSNSRLVVDNYGNGKLRLERVTTDHLCLQDARSEAEEQIYKQINDKIDEFFDLGMGKIVYCL